MSLEAGRPTDAGDVLANTWKAVKGVCGYRLELRGHGEAYVSLNIDQFGRCRSFSHHGMESPVHFAEIHKAVAAARACMPADRGRYGTRNSKTRLRYCEIVAEELNAQKKVLIQLNQ